MTRCSLLCCSIIAGLLLPLPAAAQPANGWIVWASNRQDGRHEIYRMKADGTGVTRLTKQGGKSPTWSPDGAWVSYHRVETDEAYVIRPDGTGEKKLGAGWPRFWLYDGSGVAVQQGFDVYLYDPDSGARVKKLWSKSEFSRVASSTYQLFEVVGLTPNKRWLVIATDFYKNGATGDNGTFKHGWGPQLFDLQNKDKIYFVGAGCEGTTSPISNDVYHVNGEVSPNYRFYTMDTADAATRSSYRLFYDHPEADWGHEYFPRLSTDGKWLTYGATTGCHDHDTCDYEIFIHQMGDGMNRTRLTTNGANDQWPHLYLGPLWQAPTPKIGLSSTKVAFMAQQGAAAPGSKVVSVENAGTGILAAVSTSVEYTSGSGWLQVSTSGSGNSQSLDNAVDASTLSPGSYEATVTVNAQGAANSPQRYSVTLSVVQELISGEVHLKINSGGEARDGWTSDAPYRTGGEPYTFKESTVDLNGQIDPAPAQVYLTCIHLDHSYSFPVPDGRYLVRLHFYDALGEGRAMDYTIEGEKLLDDFSISGTTGGPYRALIKEFEVQVQDGDGLQIVASKDQGDDAFESAIEIVTLALLPAEDSGAASDGGTAAPPPAVDVSVPGGDAGVAPASGSNEELVSGCAVGGGTGGEILGMLLALALMVRRRRAD